MAAIAEMVPERVCLQLAQAYFRKEQLAALGQPLELVPHLVAVAGECGSMLDRTQLTEKLEKALSETQVPAELVSQEAEHARTSFARHWIRALDGFARRNASRPIALSDRLLPMQMSEDDQSFMRSSVEALTTNTVLCTDDIETLQCALSDAARKRLPLTLPLGLSIQDGARGPELVASVIVES